MSQLSFTFQNSSNKNPFSEEDFLVLAENSAAFEVLNKFFAQKDFTESQFESLMIRGEAASGKSHLLNIFAKKFQAEILKKENISSVNPANFFVENNFYIFDNINEIKDEELILRVINSATEAKAFLILSLQNHRQFSLRDLTSRLKNILTIDIENPSLESIKQLLANGFSRRQIKLSGLLIDFIANHIERSYTAILAAIKIVEFYCNENGKNIGMKEVRALFMK